MPAIRTLPRRSARSLTTWGLAAVLALGWAAAGGHEDAATADLGIRRFETRPDLRPPSVRVTTPADAAAPGLLMLTPAASTTAVPVPGVQTGPMIVDGKGQPVWFAPTRTARSGDLTNATADMKVQRYEGQDVLTYWRGDIQVPPGLGHGEYVVLDESYREIAVIRAGDGLSVDLHDLVLTPQGTALVMSYVPVADPGTPDNEGLRGTVMDNVVQEVDVETGKVLDSWSALDHIPITDTFAKRDKPTAPLDYLHLNSIALTEGGDLILSARHTHAVYRVDRETGEVEWTLGGKSNDFRFGPGAAFKFQHDVRPLPGGRMSIFDNNAATIVDDVVSRALVLQVDERARTANLLREVTSEQGLLAFSQGSAQVLPGGNILVGWGSSPWLTEFGRAGRTVFEATFGDGLNSYRAYRARWVGRPAEPIAVRAVPSVGETSTVRVSWNGATEVATWRVYAGPDEAELEPVAEGPRTGFESTVRAPVRAQFVQVEALDRSGRVIGRSEPVRVLR